MRDSTAMGAKPRLAPGSPGVSDGCGQPYGFDTIGAEALADLFGISRRAIEQLATRGVLRKTAPGKFALRASVRDYTAHLRAQAAARSGSKSLTAERTRLAREQADKLELANQAARRELVPAREVEAVWATILRDVRAAMLALPGRLQQRLGHLTAHDVAQIDREVRDALTEAGNAA